MPGINAPLMLFLTSVIVFAPTLIAVLLISMSAAGDPKVGLATVPFTVGQLLVQLSLPSSTQEPLAFLYQILLSVVTATTA